MFVYREEYYLDKAQPVQRKENREAFTKDLNVGKKDELAHGKAEIIISKQRLVQLVIYKFNLNLNSQGF